MILHRLRFEPLDDDELNFRLLVGLRVGQLPGDEIPPKIEKLQRLGFVESSGEEDGGTDSRTFGRCRDRYNFELVGGLLEDMKAHLGRVVLVGD